MISATVHSGPWHLCTINVNQENGADHWQVSETTFSRCVVYGSDHEKTPILCPQDVCQMRRSCDSYERCTAILVGTTTILSVCMRHKGYDEENYIVSVMNEGKEMGAVDFFVGGDRNRELELEGCGGDLAGIDSVDWCGLYGPYGTGGGDDVVT